MALQQIDDTMTSPEMHELYELCVCYDDEELKINLFAALLQQRCIPKSDLTAKTVLRQSFPDIFTSKSMVSHPPGAGKERDFSFSPGNKFSFIDYETDKFTKQTKGDGKGTVTNLQYTQSLTDIPDIGALGARPGARSGARPRTTTDPQHKQSSSVMLPTEKESAPKPKARTRRMSSGSMMIKGNCSVIVIAAMRRQLEMVDDDEDGKVDLEEFKEVCFSKEDML